MSQPGIRACSPLRRLASRCALGLAAALGLLAEAAAQQPIHLGKSVRRMTEGMLVPLQLSFDSSDTLYMGSGYVDAIHGSQVPLFRMLPDGTVDLYAQSIDDPDALIVGPDGMVYTGAFGGRVFQIDPLTGSAALWKQHAALGNIDGMRWFQGDLYTVAIDNARVYRIDGATKVHGLFADFSGLGVTGLTGIAFHPTVPRAYLGSPWQNVIWETDLSGNVTNPAVAQGFDFVGHLEFDESGLHGEDLFVADNGAGQVYRVDVMTGQKVLYYRYIDPLTGGLAFDSSGRLHFSRITDDGTVGEIWREEDLWLSLEKGASNGGRANAPAVKIHSTADAGERVLLMASVYPTNSVINGRVFPLGPPVTLISMPVLSAQGESLYYLGPVYGSTGMAGRTIYFGAATFEQGYPIFWMGMSERLEVKFP